MDQLEDKMRTINLGDLAKLLLGFVVDTTEKRL